MLKLASSPLVPFLSCLVLVVCILPQISNAQAPTTDPSEVRALNSLFQHWNAQAPSETWNISGEPCSGTALNESSWNDINPSIVCNCSYDSGTTCHITTLRVNFLNKEGVFSEDLAALPYLQLLKVDHNSLTGTLPAFIGSLTALRHLAVEHNMLSGPIPKELGNLKELYFLRHLKFPCHVGGSVES